MLPETTPIVEVEKAKLTLDEACRLLLEASNLMPLVPEDTNNPEDDTSD